MNEKLTVRDFGPIKHAEVEFKRVTVFIGPTGGGKSTLAKLAAVCKMTEAASFDAKGDPVRAIDKLLTQYELQAFKQPSMEVRCRLDSDGVDLVITEKEVELGVVTPTIYERWPDFMHLLKEKTDFGEIPLEFLVWLDEQDKKRRASPILYLPAERVFAAAAHDAPAGLQASNVALPHTLLSFMAEFEVARKELRELPLPFFGVTYRYEDGVNQIVLPSGKVLRLTEAASGLQSVVPLLVTIEYQRRQLEKAERGTRSFIVEEPELNLFPTAQTHIIDTLASICTKADDELIINTHSPYVLSHLNLLLYAWQVAQQHPDRTADIAAIAPQEAWINPAEFAVYYVADETVRSIFDAELGLIDHNELDAIGARSADQFDQLVDISNGL